MSQGLNPGRSASCCIDCVCAGEGNLRGLVRQLSIDQFENEGRRVSMGTDSVQKPQRTPLFERHSSDPGVHKVHLARTKSDGIINYSAALMAKPCIGKVAQTTYKKHN